jgi:hypothetical protein
MTAQSREMSFWQNIIWDESPVRLGIAQKNIQNFSNKICFASKGGMLINAD